MNQSKKQSWADRIKKRNKLGFSLVELVVVIAIMAIMTAVLAPSLLSYVERARAQKDFSAMDEVTNAVFLAMSDPYVYDELAKESMKQNVSCYIDTNNEAMQDGDCYKQTKDEKTYDQYMFTDSARKLDEVKFYFAGNMRGTTITFVPDTNSNKSTYVISAGVINKALSDGSTKAKDLPHLYNAIRQVIGDRIELSSQTYRNSEYTIFIKIGTTGGNEADAQDAMLAYGQFSGTNLPLGGQNYSVAFGRIVADPNEGVSPGYGKNDAVLNPNTGIKPVVGDTYVSTDPNYDDFTYTYADGGWAVSITDKTKEVYDPIMETINGEPITSLQDAFTGCANMKVAPIIPDTVTNMKCTFKECSSLVVAPKIPSGVTNLKYTFQKCYSLTTAPDISQCSNLQDIQGTFKGCTNLETYHGSTDSDGNFSKWIIPDSVTVVNQCFDGCQSLVVAPKMPDNVTSMRYVFNGCIALKTAPAIPSKVIYVSSAFAGCTSLTGTIEVDVVKMSAYGGCFRGVDMANIIFTGSASKDVLNLIGATGDNWTPIP